MPIERFACLVFAVGIIVAILIGVQPLALPNGWDKVAHFVVFSLLTLCLWRATEGRMPLFVLAGVIFLGAMDEWRQAYLPDRSSDAKDFLADLCAALSTGALLFIQRKPVCAESSPQ
jgi:VanZ family protein